MVKVGSTTPSASADLPYRRGVGAVVINTAGLVFVGRRRDTTPEAWQLPQGGIDAGETPEQALLRELEEEIGTRKVRIVGETADWLSYDLPEAVRGRVWRGRYRGQTQKWFAVRFTGTDADIDIATAEPEFDAWAWMPFEVVCRNIVPFKRDLYAAVFRTLSPYVCPVEPS